MANEGVPVCPIHHIPVTKKGIQDIWHKGGVMTPTQRYFCRPTNGDPPHTLTNPSFLTSGKPSGKSKIPRPATGTKKRHRRQVWKDPAW